MNGYAIFGMDLYSENFVYTSYIKIHFSVFNLSSTEKSYQNM